MTRITNTITHIMNTSIIAFFGTLFVIIAIVACQSFERKYMPVVTNIQLIQSGDMIFNVRGEKTRPCTFKELHIQVKNEIYEKADVEFLEDRTAVTRGLGYQSFGRWKIVPSGNMVKIESVHECHPFWDTVTEIGEFNVRGKNGY